jgi:phenylalanyl-tRNA synthetase alpha chain
MEQLELEKILKALDACITEADIQSFHAGYLGKKGQISCLFKTLGKLDPDQRKEQGKKIKELFDTVEQAFIIRQQAIKTAAWNEQLSQDLIDSSIPGMKWDTGHLTLLSKTRRRVEEIFQGM